MTQYVLELELFWCVAINALVFGGGYLFASRRITKSRSQAALDAALIGFAIQYVAVCGPGIFGLLTPAAVTLVAATLGVVLVVSALRNRSKLPPLVLNRSTIAVVAIAAFAGAFILCFAHSQASLPVFSNDALTYHFAAAVGWLRSHRITLLPTWFFNPANTYSPLAGSAFIAWLLVPFSGDAVARFVEVPALLAIGLGVYRLGRELGGSVIVAAIAAASAVLCRPLFLQCMMGKDDLFVVLFLLVALVGLSPARSTERLGAWRVGLAIGLLLATKMTVLVVVSTLVLAVDGNRWASRRWAGGFLIIMLIAGPWFFRTWIDTGNPIFPVRVGQLLPGLFTTARSEALASGGGWRVLVGGTYALPAVLAFLLGTTWLAAVLRRTGWREPLWRAATLGPLVGIATFYFLSPFPEFRFVTPLLAILFAITAAVFCRWLPGRAAVAAALVLAIASVSTVEVADQFAIVLRLLCLSTVIAFATLAIMFSAVRLSPARRVATVYVPIATAAVLLVFVQWAAYVRGCRDTLYAGGSAYQQKYPEQLPLWKFIDESVPADATLAYANMHMIYPLQGPALRRRVVYVPTRRGVTSIASLPYLGDHLSGERLVRTAVAATVAQSDEQQWIERLKVSDARYLVIGSVGSEPVEVGMCLRNREIFRQIYQCDTGIIFSITWPGRPAH